MSSIKIVSKIIAEIFIVRGIHYSSNVIGDGNFFKVDFLNFDRHFL